MGWVGGGLELDILRKPLLHLCGSGGIQELWTRGPAFGQTMDALTALLGH